ncbi:hypothetical protein, partial [Verrucomicrobium sp. BvORR106]|uniref:hypothetical protein n=1 Tax=Verrucomicrobium sp. BvORR106 TaxID=1403819 RepID=UPI00056EEEE4
MLSPTSFASRATAATLLLIHPLMMLPSDLWAQAAAAQDVAPHFADLPDTFKEDWVPPAPVLSARDIVLNKAAP